MVFRKKAATDNGDAEGMEEKKAESKKNSLAATKKAKKIKTEKTAKKIVDKAIVTMAASMPGAGQGKALIQVTHTLDKIDEQIAALNLAKRGERAKLKEMKVELRVYDHVRRLRKMEPEDVKAFKATQALIENQLGMELSTMQKDMVEDISKKREAARTALALANGGDTGKEVGSAAAAAHSDETEKEDEKDTSETESPAKPAIPPLNPTIHHAFKASNATH